MKIDARSAVLGALSTTTLALLVSAQAQEPASDPMLEALKALTAAQERQAVAWESLAEKGWPTPQNVTVETGEYGARWSPLHVTLSGGLSNNTSGYLSLSGTITDR